jgi:hypothetical protein
MRILGIPLHSIRDLINHNCLLPFGGPTVDGGKVWKVCPDEVDSLIARIGKMAIPLEKINSSKLINFNFAMRMVVRLGDTIGIFVQAILKGEIVLCKSRVSKRDYFGGLRFLKESVSDYVSQHMQAQKNGALYLKEAAPALNITIDTAYYLRDVNIIKVNKSKKSMWHGSLITHEEIKKFGSVYVSASELARRHGTNTSMMMNLLAGQKVLPAFGPEINKCPQYIYRRSDIKKIDPAELLMQARTSITNCNPVIKLKPKEAADLLGINVNKVNRLIKNGLLSPFVPRSHVSSQVLLKTASIKRYLRLFNGQADLVSAPVAARMLGETRYNMYYRLVDPGHLTPVKLKEKTNLNYFKISDVKKLVRKDVRRKLADRPQ